MTDLRVLVDATTLRPAMGGVTTYVLRLLQAWGHAWPGDRLTVALSAGLDFTVPDGMEQVRFDRAPRQVARQVLVPRWRREVGADVVLTVGPDLPLFDAGDRYVCVAHDFRHVPFPAQFSAATRLYRNTFHVRSLRRAARVIAISEQTRREIAQVSGRSEGVVVIGHGGDHVHSAKASPGGGPALAFAHWGNKRPELAVEAYAVALARLTPEVRDAAPPLHVVGADQETRASLQALTDRLGATSRVVVRSYLDDDEFDELLFGASMIVMPTQYEGFGLPAIEAATLGIPFIGTRDVGMEDAAGPEGLLVEGTVTAFANAIERVLTDADLRASIREDQPAWAAARTWHATAAATRAVVAEVAAGLSRS